MSSQAPDSSYSSSNAETSENRSSGRSWARLFTPSVNGAINSFDPYRNILSLEIVSQLIKAHPEYGGKKGQETYHNINTQSTPKTFTVKPPGQWAEEVVELYDTGRTQEFHGRLLIIGLAMLDEQLRDILNDNGFLAAVISEVKEDMTTLLNDTGQRYYAELYNRDIEQEDYLRNNDDNPLDGDDKDGLDRAEFARFIVQLLDKTSLKNGAFAVHLYAPWGAGKTSFMNFMKKYLVKERPGDGPRPEWHIIDFNAWQNQSLPYPWWNFMNNIYAQLKDRLPWQYRFREWFWRFKAQRLHQTIALLLICFLLFYYGSTNVKNASGWFDPFNKLLAALAGIWGIAISLSQNFTRGSHKAAQNYLDSKDNPMAEYKQKFNQLVGALSPAQIIIFIDDLDRCKSAYVVELLESIQTLFKKSNVLFVVAADMTWLHASYEVEYEKIKGYVRVEGKTIGPLFIEKMFQLSVALPGVPDHIKERCWNGMLGIEDPSSTEKINIENTSTKADKLAGDKAFEAEHQKRLNKLGNLASQANMQKTEHYLRPFSRYLDLNPRNMKRLLNNYLINKAASLVSHIDIDKRQLVLFTILNIQWPVLASFLIKNPECMTQRDNLPVDISDLMRQDEVIAVLEGQGFNDPLREETLIACGLLFGSVGYHHHIAKQPTTPAVVVAGREQPAA